MPLRDPPECEVIRFGKRVIYNFPPTVEPGGTLVPAWGFWSNTTPWGDPVGARLLALTCAWRPC